MQEQSSKWKDECAVLIVSCDKNLSLLKIFFDFFHKNWSDCPFPVFLGLEQEMPIYENVNVICSDIKEFSGRVRDYIQKIGYKYVLVILDDFILEKKVCNKDIMDYYNLLSSDEKIANITLAWITAANSVTNHPHVLRRDWNAEYLMNFQVGFWNATVLYSLLKDRENAWQAELFGSIRARNYKEYSFLNLDADKNMPYLYNRGWLIVKGAWNGNEIKRLHLEKYVDLFLDGKKILYSDFGKISKRQSIPLRLGVLLRKVMSKIGFFF